MRRSQAGADQRGEALPTHVVLAAPWIAMASCVGIERSRATDSASSPGVPVLFDVAASDRDCFNAQQWQLTQIAPHGGEIDV